MKTEPQGIELRCAQACGILIIIGLLAFIVGVV